MLASLVFNVSVKAGIPNWQEAYKTGTHGTWAWAKIYAIWNTYTKNYYGHQHDHNWGYGDPGYYRVTYSWSNDPYYPWASTKVEYSSDGQNYQFTGAYAKAQLQPLE
ncbi:MAG: hypothetical protein QXZ25_03125 [Candidatus Bathyarchaeia archaeon]